MRLFRNLIIGAIAALGLALPAVAAERAIIVLDGSGSMWAQIEGKARITIARETLASVLQTLPEDLELGFMTYGHREKGNCDDIEMLVEPAVGTGAAIAAALCGGQPPQGRADDPDDSGWHQRYRAAAPGAADPLMPGAEAGAAGVN